MKLLAKRGLAAKERDRLQSLVEVALGPTETLAAPAPDSGARRQKLVALRGWFDEWSSAARAVVKKRGYLIRLGLATRKVKQKDATPATPPPADPKPPKGTPG